MKREFIIGTIAITAIGALIFGLFYLKGENILSNNRVFHTTFQSVDGLVNASPVKISGYQVGVVTNMKMNPEGAKLLPTPLPAPADVPVCTELLFCNRAC